MSSSSRRPPAGAAGAAADSPSAVPPQFRSAVRANAVFCGVSGVAIAALAGRLPGLLGAGERSLYLSLGVFLALYALNLAWRAGHAGLGRAEGWLIVGGDVAWVAGSAAVIAAGALSAAGAWAVGLVAGVVGGFAVWQARALQSAGG